MPFALLWAYLEKMLFHGKGRSRKMHFPSVAFCVDTQSEAEGILNDITKQKGSPFYAKKSVRPAGLTDFLLINDVAALYA